MIQYLEFPPAQHLYPFIECLWVLKGQGIFFRNRELIIPGGRIELIFNLGDQVEWFDSKEPDNALSCHGAHLLGPRNRPFFVRQNGIVHVVGVRFRHGGFAAFSEVPMTMLTNSVVAGDQVFGNGIIELTERIYENVPNTKQAALIQHFLTQRIHNEADIRPMLQLISWVRESDPLSLTTVTEQTGIHYKKLERVFSRYTGYNPKNFTRVIRFYKALKEMNAKPCSLTGIGLNGGYYDQPHFIREFRAFTGQTPSQFNLENPAIANLLLRSRHV